MNYFTTLFQNHADLHLTIIVLVKSEGLVVGLSSSNICMWRCISLIRISFSSWEVCDLSFNSMLISYPILGESEVGGFNRECVICSGCNDWPGRLICLIDGASSEVSGVACPCQPYGGLVSIISTVLCIISSV